MLRWTVEIEDFVDLFKLIKVKYFCLTEIIAYTDNRENISKGGAE